MKKLNLVTLVLAAVLVLSGCGGTSNNGNANSGATSSPSPEVTNNSEGSENSNEGTEVEEEPTEAPTETETPEAAAYGVGEKFTLGEWGITLDSFEFDQKVSDKYLSSSVEEGNKYLILNYTVENTASEAKNFTAMFQGIGMKAVFQDKYEYDYGITLIDGDLSKESIKPLASKTGFVVMEVPDLVATSEDSLIVNIDDKGEKAQIKLR